jgi:hypothetical protein
LIQHWRRDQNVCTLYISALALPERVKRDQQFWAKSSLSTQSK